MIKLSEENLTNVLTILRSESRKLNFDPTESSLKSLMQKYDMLFVGENFNSIYSLELLNTLKKHFDIVATNEELNFLIPMVCKKLNMTFEPLAYAENVGKDTIDCYAINL